MNFRTKLIVVFSVIAAVQSIVWAAHLPSRSWVEFVVFLAVVLLCSGLKVPLPKGDGSMSLNFPFILLSIMRLSPLQSILLVALSVAAQCRIRVINSFSAVQILFNIANAITATTASCLTYLVLVKFHIATAPAISVAASAYFFCSTIPVAIVIGLSKGEHPLKLWRAEFSWYLPFYMVGAVLAAIVDHVSLRFGWASALLLVPLVYTVYRSYVAQIVRIKEREQHLLETEALHLRTIEGLAMAIEAKDQNTHDHLIRVRKDVAEIGKALNLDKLQMQALQTAALLHDIGKLAVPEHIINKPGKLTPEEFEKMKIHPVVGADILERVRFPYPVVPIVRSHHEWWNGRGYPDGLEGEQIPIGARILTAVDCFDALVTDRPYRKAIAPEEAMALLKKMSGTQFDPTVVEALDDHYRQLENEAASQTGQDFVPLDTEVEVWRGRAPGAGFQNDNAPEGAKANDGEDSSSRSTSAAAFASLNLIAAASQEAQALFEMSQSLGNSLSLKETISVMASRLHHLIQFDCCALYVKNGDTLISKYVDGNQSQHFSAQVLALGQGISGWVAESGKSILNGNARVEPNYQPQPGHVGLLTSALSTPLFNLQGDVFAVLTLYSIAEEPFSRDHLRILQAMESKLSLSLQNSLRFRRVEMDAETDFLTNLPNARRLFLQLETELSRCQRTAGTLAIVVCDLNSFKTVNDCMGHLAGNMLLSSIAEVFRRGCRPYDTVARIGGDEFVFLIPDMDENSSQTRLKAIAKSVTEACQETGADEWVSASLGASFYPADAHTAEELLALADRRMYLDKQSHYKSAPADTNAVEEGVAV